MKKLIKIDNNGTKYYEEYVKCDRCGSGNGTYAIGVCNGQLIPSSLDNGVCWKCHGVGMVWETTKEYTPEHLAKLEKARARREAKKAAENAAREAEIAAESERIEKERREAEARAAEERARIEAEKAKSNFVGSIGDKIEFTAIVKRSFAYKAPSYYGYGDEIKHIHEFVDSDGNVYVWHTSAAIMPNEGDTVTVKGTIKKHSEYKGTKQTVLNRCKVAAV